MALPAPLSLTLYRGLTGVFAGIAPLWLAVRAAGGKEIWSRRGERYGRDESMRPAGPLIWCHAASVGESLTLLPLLAALLEDRNRKVLLTTGTVTSARLMAERLPAGAFHRFVPLDHGPWVRRFLDHWRPDAILWTESELWPNTLAEIAARNIPAALINGRLSDRAFHGWERRRGFAQYILHAFRLVLGQSPEDARRFSALGASNVHAAGNLKLAATPLPADDAALAAFAAGIEGRKTWLAASIHPGEDEIVAATHRTLRPRHPGLLTVIVPRHPPKAADMAATCTEAGLAVARRSRDEPIVSGTDVYIADTIGELGLFYRACDPVFVGKSLAVGGGQNPAEPALMGRAIVLGPDMGNFRDMTAALLAAGAAAQVATAAALTDKIDALLTDTAARKRQGETARAFMAAHGRALADTLAHLAPLLAAPAQLR
jgi:3-deoxy-D-manno-octulosonic-acid transferase